MTPNTRPKQPSPVAPAVGDETAMAAAARWTKWHVGLLVLALCGMAWALVMWAMVSAAGKSLPGCGPTAGCSEVLASKWALVFGVPVGLLAAALDACVACWAWRGCRKTGATPKRRAIVQGCLAGCLFGAVMWFVGLQAFVLGQWCKWCLVAHGFGLAMAIMLSVPPKRLLAEHQETHWPFKTQALGTLFGLMAAGTLAGLQILSPEPLPAEVMQAQTGDADSQTAMPTDEGVDAASRRSVQVFGGQLTVDTDTAWVVGSPTAADTVVVLFDHACPHCRHTHEAFDQAIAEGMDLCVLAVPLPLSIACNDKGLVPDEAGGRFADSCERAALASGIRSALGNQAADQFNRWLLGTSPVASAEAAKAQAIAWFGQDAVDQALADPKGQAALRAALSAYNAIDALDRLPVVASPNHPTTGRLTSVSQIQTWLHPTP